MKHHELDDTTGHALLNKATNDELSQKNPSFGSQMACEGFQAGITPS